MQREEHVETAQEEVGAGENGTSLHARMYACSYVEDNVARTHARTHVRTLTASKTALGSPGRRNAKPAAAPINVYMWQYSSDCHAWLTAPSATSKLYAVMLGHEAFPPTASSQASMRPCSIRSILQRRPTATAASPRRAT